MTEQDAFEADIAKKQDDIALRLIYADWLDENDGPVACDYCGGRNQCPKLDGTFDRFWNCPKCDGRSNGYGARAEFIRVQCEIARLESDEVMCHQPGSSRGDWCDDSLCPKCGPSYTLRSREMELKENLVLQFCGPGGLLWYDMDKQTGISPNAIGVRFRRGFAESVKCLLAVWIGTRCERCDGDGKAHGADRLFEWSGPDSYPGSCPAGCDRGLIGGHGKEILARQPVVRVETEKEPENINGRNWCWFKGRGRLHDADAARLPDDLFDLLESSAVVGYDTGGWISKDYPSIAAAQADLSQALLRLAKGERV